MKKLNLINMILAIVYVVFLTIYYFVLDMPFNYKIFWIGTGFVLISITFSVVYSIWLKKDNKK